MDSKAMFVLFCVGVAVCIFGVYRTARHIGFADGTRFILWCLEHDKFRVEGKELVLMEDGEEFRRVRIEDIHFDYESRVM